MYMFSGIDIGISNQSAIYFYALYYLLMWPKLISKIKRTD